MNREVFETWDWIRGYEGYYKVSTLGRVESSKGLRKLQKATHGYLQVCLSKNGKLKQKQLKQIVNKI